MTSYDSTGNTTPDQQMTHGKIDDPPLTHPSKKTRFGKKGAWFGLFSIVGFGTAVGLWWQSSLIAATPPKTVLSIPSVSGSIAAIPAPSFPEVEKDGNFMVFSGSFVSYKNAERISRQLGEVGIAAHLQAGRMAGRQLTHVLVGPFGDEEDAEETVAWIRERTGIPASYLNINPSETLERTADDHRVEKPATRVSSTRIRQPVDSQAAGTGTAAVDRAGPPLRAGEYVVLAGSFTNVDNANRVHNRLRKHEIPSRLKTSHVNERLFTHVMVGPYEGQEEADRMVTEIRKNTGIVAEKMKIH